MPELATSQIRHAVLTVHIYMHIHMDMHMDIHTHIQIFSNTDSRGTYL